MAVYPWEQWESCPVSLLSLRTVRILPCEFIPENSENIALWVYYPWEQWEYCLVRVFSLSMLRTMRVLPCEFISENGAIIAWWIYPWEVRLLIVIVQLWEQKGYCFKCLTTMMTWLYPTSMYIGIEATCFVLNCAWWLQNSEMVRLPLSNIVGMVIQSISGILWYGLLHEDILFRLWPACLLYSANFNKRITVNVAAFDIGHNKVLYWIMLHPIDLYHSWPAVGVSKFGPILRSPVKMVCVWVKPGRWTGILVWI